MECVNKVFIYKNLDAKEFKEGMYVDCGKCIICRTKRAREKAIRLVHEYRTGFNKASFLTFSIADEYKYAIEHANEEGYTVLNRDFIKKMRDRIYKKLYRKKLRARNDWRYIFAGEYGGKSTLRAHYHMVILAKDRKTRDMIIKEWLKEWTYGKVDVINNTTERSIFYTAGYTAKKIGTKDKLKRAEPFLMMSTGCGKLWCFLNNRKLLQDKCIKNQANGKVYIMKIPRYYIKMLRYWCLWTKEEYEEYKESMKQIQETKNDEMFERCDKELLKNNIVMNKDRFFNKEWIIEIEDKYKRKQKVSNLISILKNNEGEEILRKKNKMVDIIKEKINRKTIREMKNKEHKKQNKRWS